MSRQAFWLKNNRNNLCLKSDATGADCKKLPTLDMLWVWTNQNKHLMNVKTLKCMQRQKEKRVIMKQCEKNDFQTVWCKMENSNLQIGWQKWFGKWYLHFSKRRGKTYATSKLNAPSSWSSNGNSCKTSKNYKGIVYIIIIYNFILPHLIFFNLDRFLPFR